MTQLFLRSSSNITRLFALVALSIVLSVSHAPVQAQTTFDVIAPREYDLPVGFEPFNVVVQYAYIQNNDKAWGASGNKIAGSGTEQIVGLTKYVRFWTPHFSNKVGLAWEVIQPEIGVRDSGTGTFAGGFGDTITGFAGWIKPTQNSTFGIQSFVQIPIGDSSVSDTNWKNLTSFLWDVRLPYNFGWTADAGWVWQGKRADNGLTPGTTFHTNQRFGWKFGGWIEPFLALDYEHTEASDGIPASWALDGGVGVKIDTYKNHAVALRYSRGLDGKNHSFTDSWNLQYLVVW